MHSVCGDRNFCIDFFAEGNTAPGKSEKCNKMPGFLCHVWIKRTTVTRPLGRIDARSVLAITRAYHEPGTRLPSNNSCVQHFAMSGM